MRGERTLRLGYASRAAIEGGVYLHEHRDVVAITPGDYVQIDIAQEGAA